MYRECVCCVCSFKLDRCNVIVLCSSPGDLSQFCIIIMCERVYIWFGVIGGFITPAFSFILS